MRDTGRGRESVSEGVVERHREREGGCEGGTHEKEK